MRQPTEKAPAPPVFSSSIDYEELGHRLRAYRIGASLQAEDVAEKLGVSRAVVYRMEQGQIVKIETVERLAQLLGTSMASLLGVEVEYYAGALGFLERIRQVERDASRIFAHFDPISLLLVSDDYLQLLHTTLLESTSESAGQQAEVDAILAILRERKALFELQRPHILSLIGLRAIERFLLTGLVGRLDLAEDLRLQRIQAARREVERIAELMEAEPMNVQIALVDEVMPSASFQILVGARRTMLAVSPFRFGELPTIGNGIATITASSEPVKLYEQIIDRLWSGAYKSQAGAAQLRMLLKRTR